MCNKLHFYKFWKLLALSSLEQSPTLWTKTLEEPLKNHTTQVGPMGQRGLGGTRKAFMSWWCALGSCSCVIWASWIHMMGPAIWLVCWGKFSRILCVASFVAVYDKNGLNFQNKEYLLKIPSFSCSQSWPQTSPLFRPPCLLLYSLA